MLCSRPSHAPPSSRACLPLPDQALLLRVNMLRADLVVRRDDQQHGGHGGNLGKHRATAM